ncbi:hypothetical protein MNBD_GAMMA06-980 [hydrothermal vent metagenome]|uniref:Uncharacterized protein n=1 Tax=hydrothermal vent metagenome TaxID=652676 RepID=A0A3B0WK18_9ZZZZ
MSGGIQLSSEMIADVKAVVMKNDPAADNDLYFMQYLSAITGYVLAHQDQPDLDKKSLLSDLSHFMGQVLNQVEQDMKPAEDAFGVWKPGDS